MDNLWFQKITITQIQYIKQIKKILDVTFEFTGAARGFMIMYCAARRVKKVGQHCFTVTACHSQGAPPPRVSVYLGKNCFID